MTVSTPNDEFYSMNLSRLCIIIQCTRKEKPDKKFRIRRLTSGLWRLSIS